jgi:hypothetical protein
MLRYGRPGVAGDPRADEPLSRKTPYPLHFVTLGSRSEADEGHCKWLDLETSNRHSSRSQREQRARFQRSGNSDRREQQGPIVTGTDSPATSSSLSRVKYGSPSTVTEVPALPTNLRRNNSECNLFPEHRHYDVLSRSWPIGLPRVGSTSPRVQQIHREMLDVFEQAVEDELVVQVAAVSPGRERYSESPEPHREPAQKLHCEMLDEFEKGVDAELLVQVPPTRDTPRRQPAPGRLRLVNNQKKTAPGRRASRDGSPVAAAEKASAASAGAAGGIDQPAAPGTGVPKRFIRRFIDRLVTNDASLRFMMTETPPFVNGLFLFLLICVCWPGLIIISCLEFI